MKSNQSNTVGSNPVFVRTHPFHPTGTITLGTLCSATTHRARGPWGSAAVASCGADQSSHRDSSVTVGTDFISHDATSRSKVVSFETGDAAVPSPAVITLGCMPSRISARHSPSAEVFRWNPSLSGSAPMSKRTRASFRTVRSPISSISGTRKHPTPSAS